jgi:hypothetical protein
MLHLNLHELNRHQEFSAPTLRVAAFNSSRQLYDPSPPSPQMIQPIGVPGRRFALVRHERLGGPAILRCDGRRAPKWCVASRF